MVQNLLFSALALMLCLHLTTSIQNTIWTNNWRCHNCGPKTNNLILFSWVRQSMMRDSREVYLNFDHKWIDEALKVNRKVVVTNVNRESLCHHTMPSSPPDQFTNTSETFHVVISLPILDLATIGPLAYRDALHIDKFLTHNPCWIPIRDPPVVQYSRHFPIAKEVIENDRLPTCTNANHSFHQPVPDLANMAAESLEHLNNNIAVFLKLPKMHFHATCQLYQFVTEKQFPSRCPANHEINNTLPFHLGSIGWSHCVNTLLPRFMNALASNRLFLLPVSENFNTWVDKKVTIRVDGKTLELKYLWKWADTFACDNYTIGLNPWSCHFIPITNCTSIRFRDAVIGGRDENGVSTIEQMPYQEMVDWNFPSEFTKLRHHLIGDIQRYFDAPDLLRASDFDHGREYLPDLRDPDVLMWIFHRLESFLQRPNIHTRDSLRRSLLNVHKVHPTNTNFAGTGKRFSSSEKDRQNRQLQIRRKSETQLNLNELKIDWNRRFTNLQPCIGLHIRHGDSSSDWRGQLKLDRSAAHFGSTANKAAHLIGGIENIFVATDNITAVSDIAALFPDLRWYFQMRPLQVYNGGFATHFNGESKKQDLADLLADLVSMSRCSAIIASFDSGFAEFLLHYMQSRDKLGTIPMIFHRGSL